MCSVNILRKGGIFVGKYSTVFFTQKLDQYYTDRQPSLSYEYVTSFPSTRAGHSAIFFPTCSSCYVNMIKWLPDCCTGYLWNIYHYVLSLFLFALALSPAALKSSLSITWARTATDGKSIPPIESLEARFAEHSMVLCGHFKARGNFFTQ